MNFCLIRVLLLLVTIHELLEPVQSVNGVIWDKKVGNFVPIFSVPAFSVENQKILNESRKQETHNFQGRIVKFTYYEELNIVNSDANGTRVSGAIGEIWNILAEFLNFTIKPILSEVHTLDVENENGLLKISERNETDVIPIVESFSDRLDSVQLTVPLWQTSYRFYIRREVNHLPDWMVKLFSRKVWYAILITYLLLSVCSYLSQTINSKFMNEKPKADLNDHFFYNFGMICGQGYFPSCACKSSRMVELWLGIFSCLIRTAFGALLIRYMTQTTNIPPFDDFDSLVDDSPYIIVTLRGSLPHIIFDIHVDPDHEKVLQMNRHVVVETMEELYKAACSPNNFYTMYQSEDIKKARGLYICRLNPVGEVILVTWIASGISWAFSYKRSIDIGILRLYEVGFINLLKNRWIEAQNVEYKSNPMEAIAMDQVYLMILVFTAGTCISFVILFFENLAFYCSNYHKNHTNKI